MNLDLSEAWINYSSAGRQEEDIILIRRAFEKAGISHEVPYGPALKAYFLAAAALTLKLSFRAGICWSSVVPPVTFSFEIDGTDVNGNKISATASVPFQGPASPQPQAMSERKDSAETVRQSRSAPVLGRSNVKAGRAVQVLEANRFIRSCCARGRAHSAIYTDKV